MHILFLQPTERLFPINSHLHAHSLCVFILNWTTSSMKLRGIDSSCLMVNSAAAPISNKPKNKHQAYKAFCCCTVLCSGILWTICPQYLDYKQTRMNYSGPHKEDSMQGSGWHVAAPCRTQKEKWDIFNLLLKNWILDQQNKTSGTVQK